MEFNINQIISLSAGVAIVVFIVIKFIRSKTGKFDDALGYLDQIKDVLEQVVQEASDIESMKESAASEEEYRNNLLSTAIERLKIMGEDLNINMDILNKIPNDGLVVFISSLIDKYMSDHTETIKLKEEPVTPIMSEPEVDNRENLGEPISSVQTLNTSEYAKKYNMTVREVTEACRNGELKATKINGKWSIEDVEVDEAIAATPVNQDIKSALESFTDDFDDGDNHYDGYL